MTEALSNSTFAAFLGGAALVTLILLLVYASVPPPLSVAPVIRAFDYTPKPAAPGEAVRFTWEGRDAVAAFLKATGKPESFQVPLSGDFLLEDATEAHWTLTLVGSNGARVTESLTIARVNGWSPADRKSKAEALQAQAEEKLRRGRRNAVEGSFLALVFLAFGALGCSSAPVAQLRQPVIHSFKADPPELEQGHAAILSWTVTDAARVTLEPGGDVTGKAQQKVSPQASTSYVLTAWSADGLVARASLELPVYARAAVQGGEP